MSGYTYHSLRTTVLTHSALSLLPMCLNLSSWICTFDYLHINTRLCFVAYVTNFVTLLCETLFGLLTGEVGGPAAFMNIYQSKNMKRSPLLIWPSARLRVCCLVSKSNVSVESKIQYNPMSSLGFHNKPLQLHVYFGHSWFILNTWIHQLHSPVALKRPVLIRGVEYIRRDSNLS